MSRRAKVKRAESGASEVSDFTSDLLENLKGEFKNNLKRSSNQPSKENKLSLSLLSDAIQNSNGNPNNISDEVFIFNHIINCTKALVEVIENKTSDKEKDDEEKKKKSLFYSGLLDHIGIMVKATMLPSTSDTTQVSAAASTKSNSADEREVGGGVFNNDIDRMFLTSHSLMTFPLLASNDSFIASKKAPLLHYTVFNSNDINLVKAVYFSNPDAIKTPDKDGALPLHWATLGTNTTILQFLLEKYPAAAGEVDTAGYIPLHWAVNQDRPCMEVYKVLLNAYPQGASFISPKNGTLPLHWCVNRPHPDLHLVKELITAHSAGLRTPCRDGWLPLHYCVNHGKISLDVLKLLLSRYPSAVMFKNEDGQLPVHRLLDRDDSSKKALKMLLEVSPECLVVPDAEGYVPLHIALDGSNPPSWRLIKLLLETAPDAIKMKTNRHFLPLHIAMKMNDSHGGEVNVNAPTAPVEPDEPLSDDEYNQETIDRLNANRYLSIIQELTSMYPEAVHDVAIDVIPTEATVPDLYTYTGDWKKSRWTPMSRAISKGKHSPIALLLRPFQKQKKAGLKSAASALVGAGRLGGPLVTAVQSGGQKLGPIVQKGEKVPRRPPPRAKKEAQHSHRHEAATDQKEQDREVTSKDMATENRSKPRIYTAEMRAANDFDDNDVSMIVEDENALKFNLDGGGSSKRFDLLSPGQC
jgi:ankyrin repeat protein